jgi:hypothetical protein
MGNSNSLDKSSIRNPLTTREEQDIGGQEHQQGGGGESESVSESPDLIESSMDTDMDGNSSTSCSSSDGIDDCVDAHSDLLQQLQNDKETVTCVAFFSLFKRRQKSFLLLNHTDNDNDNDTEEPVGVDDEHLLSPLSSSSSSSSLCTPKYKYWTSRSRLFSSSTSNSSFSECKGDNDNNDNDDEQDDNSGSSETDDPDPHNTNSRTPPQRVNSWISFLSDNKSTLQYTDTELALSDSQPTAASDLVSSDIANQRPVWIVTTAALPWMTGTAVNPLLRAAYLSQRYRQQRQQQQQAAEAEAARETETGITVTKSLVTLVVPWLESADDRVALYGPDWQDSTQPEQEKYIRQWLAVSAGLPLEADPDTGLQIQFYPARYHAGLSSIFAMGDFCERLQVPEYDDSSANNNLSAVCILEEPEHLNYYRKYCTIFEWLVECVTVCGRHWSACFDLFRIKYS